MKTERALAPSLAFILVAFATSSAATAVDSAAVAPIERFHSVDGRLFRGAQPNADGFRYLHGLGIRTVVNLREEREAVELGEQRMVESLGMRYLSLPVKNGNFFDRSRRIPDAAIRAFFQVVDAPDAGPVFVHCRRGADRTGAMVAMYRIAREGWQPERAYAEARALGMRSWYTGLKRQLLDFTGARLFAEQPH